ncbi:MAG: hypothetical protein KGN34_13530 [Sphingomonadales bacterium]|nr:hypothetical protein [Sphingomonadales bacterium]
MLLLCIWTAPIRALAAPAPAAPLPDPTYADLADLAEAAPLVLRVEVRKQATVEPQRAGNVRAGRVRLYIEARVNELLVGGSSIGQDVRFLADFPTDPRGKAPALKKVPLLIFARPVAASTGELQLIAPDARLPWSTGVDGRLRAVIAALRAPDAPGRVTAVRDAMYVPGTLAGAGETQITLTTAQGAPASISVTRQPGQPANWTASFGEVFDSAGKPPVPDTLVWYRLACFLPPRLPPETNLSESPADRAQAALDYRMVIESLGPCRRTHD